MENQTQSPARASWNFSADTILVAMADYPEDDRDLMVAAFRWCIDPKHPVSRADFARRVGYDETSVYKFYNNKYRHPDTGEMMPPPDKFLDGIKLFLKVERERHEGGDTEFVVTPTAKKMWLCCDLARESRSPVIVWGASQIGKTWAVEKYRQDNNHGRTLYARMKAASGLGGMVRTLSTACGISEKSNTAALIERIKRSLTEDTLLILDEMHLLANTYRVNSFFACVEVIREIHDMTRCGMVLIWTRIDSLKTHSDRELQQLWRRGVHKKPLPDMPTRGDVKAIIEYNGLTWPEAGDKVAVGKNTEHPLEVMRLVAKRDGLKAITELLRYGRKLAARGMVPLDWSHVIKAYLMIESEARQDKTAGWE